jgi:hypothetical protein
MLLCGTAFYLRFYTQFMGRCTLSAKICNRGAQPAFIPYTPNVARPIPVA